MLSESTLHSRTSTRKTTLMLVLLAIIWGSTFPFSKVSILGFSPILSTGLRFAGASVLFFILSLKNFKQKIAQVRKSDIIQALVLGTLIGATICLQNIGLSQSSPTRVAFLSYIYVIFIPPLQLIFTQKKVHAKQIIGLVVAIIGLVIFSPPTAEQINISDIVIILSSLVFAVYFICVDRFERKTNLRIFVMLQFLFALPVCIIMAVIFESMYIIPQLNPIFSLVYLILIGTGVGIFIHVRFQHHISPTRAAIIFILEPVFAAIITFFIFNIMPTASEVVGGMVILAAVLISEI